MRLLLDTHLLLWAVAASRKLPRGVKSQLLDPHNEFFYGGGAVSRG